MNISKVFIGLCVTMLGFVSSNVIANTSDLHSHEGETGYGVCYISPINNFDNYKSSICKITVTTGVNSEGFGTQRVELVSADPEYDDTVFNYIINGVDDPESRGESIIHNYNFDVNGEWAEGSWRDSNMLLKQEDWGDMSFDNRHIVDCYTTENFELCHEYPTYEGEPSLSDLDSF